MAREERLPTGPAGAAVLAAGIGSLALGLFTTLAQAIPPFGAALNFHSPVGPLSGKTILAVVVWLVAWVAIHQLWKNRQVDFDRIFRISLLLIALGLIGTFPLFFELFGG